MIGRVVRRVKNTGSASGQGQGLASRVSVKVTDKEKERTMIDRVKSFWVNEDGPTATEYAVMLALIIIAALTAITALGTKVSGIFSNVESNLSEGTAGSY